ncbi:RNase H family protein [Nonomuraea sp. NPDC003214]
MNRTPETFSACVNALPEHLQARAEALRDYATSRPRTCPACDQAREAVWLALDAAFVDDLGAAAGMLALAEQHAAAEHVPPSCIVAILEQADRPTAAPAAPAGERLVVATDGSCKSFHSGMAFLTSDGRWGMDYQPISGYHTIRDRVSTLVTELRAVALAVATLGQDASEIVLLTDSRKALKYLRAWRRGNVGMMPPGYLALPRTGRPRLVVLAEQVAAFPDLWAKHVIGHTGHPLNEAADSLAKLARRRVHGDRERERAGEIVSAAVTAWHTARAPSTGSPHAA